MKKILYVCALFCAVMLTGCNSGDSLTPKGDTTKLWPAGKNGSNLMGFIDKSGNMAIPAKYYDEYYFSCGWAFVVDETGDEFMFIDKNGKVGKSVDEEELAYMYAFYYNRLKVRDGKYYGMWDENFNLVIKADYEELGNPTADGLVAFTEDYDDDEGWGYLSDKGDVKIPAQFYSAYDFVDGMAVVGVKEGTKEEPKYKYGIIDKKGNFIVEPQKNGLFSMGENRIGMYKSSGKIVMCDKELNELSSSYDGMQTFSCGLSRVRKEKDDSYRYGFINAKGEEVIPCKYYRADYFADDVAWVKKDNDSKWELIDKNGESIIKLKDGEYPSYFHNGLCMIDAEDEESVVCRYINKSNETIYKWTPGDEEEEAPMSLEERERKNILQTPVATIYLNAERAKKDFTK